MSIEHAVDCAAAPNPHSEDASALIACTERVMAAFVRSVQKKFGSETARRAAGYWLEAFESATWTCGQAGSALKRITIAAASRLAQETGAARFVEKPS